MSHSNNHDAGAEKDGHIARTEDAEFVKSTGQIMEQEVIDRAQARRINRMNDAFNAQRPVIYPRIPFRDSGDVSLSQQRMQILS